MKYLRNIQLLAIIIILFAPVILQAKNVSRLEAEKIAQQYAEHQVGKTKNVRLNQIVIQENENNTLHKLQILNNPEQEFLYVFSLNENNEGFVIISGDDIAHPILGYSETGIYDFENLPENFAGYLNALTQEIKYAKEQNIPQSESIKAEWKALEETGIKIATTQVGPLIKTRWTQLSPYYNMCPDINGTKSVVGCTATAMAQIMKYHNYPQKTLLPIPGYITKAHHLSIPTQNIVSYDWDNMLNTYKFVASTQAQKDAVATLSYHCGISLQMDYDATGSRANYGNVPTALKTYFGYEKNIQTVYCEVPYYDPVINKHLEYGRKEWENILKEQIEMKLPVFYIGPQHAFVCDGYNDADYFHFNFGWDAYDGWFLTTALNPDDCDFSTEPIIIINIKPKEIEESGNIDIIELKKPATIVAYYNILGERLEREPISGIYITIYDNGKTEKIIK